ncbi:hypothetical protein [Bradyrhizobium sp. Arg816]|uniref:hypothetical protein n=1 Tax=Bradyrhizobium sp. Arg816 TaxID=2998491 RepID=UPI00249E6010|nr:hypothetical protein [Bradyrhizobium sp. Arg816]MDI3566439.1 hypothetical protein [Bradyrhizobium sp. Arg816]
MSQIDLDGSSLPMLTAATGTEESHRLAVGPMAQPARENSEEGDNRSWIGRALQSAVYAVLIVPFAIVVCAIAAFAILPLHTDSRCDDGYE